MGRKMADCRRFESDSNCTLTIIGEEEEVLEAATQHAMTVHGHAGGLELREQLRMILEPEDAYVPGARTSEPLPG